jgi:very-short-patch-repair endonuclease
MPVNHTQCVERAIEALAGQQIGLVGRDQAIGLGATRRMLDYRVKHGAWPLILPGVYRISVSAGLTRQLAMAATIWSAPDGLVSHETAAVLWGFEGIQTRSVHLTVPTGRRLRSPTVKVHRTGDLLPADFGWCGPIAVTSALRTAIDLAGLVVPEVLEIAIESGLRRGLFTVGQLRWRADALMGTGRRGSSELRVLLDRHDLGRTDSSWEVRTAQLLERAGLGAPVRQHPIYDHGREIARADLAYPDAHLVIEYDSDQWHSGTARRHNDAARRNQLRALGRTVIEVTPATLRQPKQFLTAIETVLAA